MHEARVTSIGSPREIIVDAYARWTALSALRSGSPIKSREDIYPLLRLARFEFVVRPEPVDSKRFNKWHRQSAERLAKAGGIPTGWATKLLNVYLKTAVYIGRLGHKSLLEHLHPPIDAGLWSGLAKKFGRRSDVCRLTHHRTRISGITSYDDYRVIIRGCRLAAELEKCMLIEVEQWWEGGARGN